MKIGIFGGSFNPITKAHIEVASNAIKELNLDKLFFVPTNININKKNIKPVDGEKRCEMIALVLEEKMIVSNFELKKGGISFTYKTIEYFKNKFPSDELFLIIGSDNLKKLNSWKKIDYIVENSKIVICKRDKWEKHINFKKYKCLLLEKEFANISSSLFLKGNYEFVDKRVRKYIFDHFLYWEEILEKTLSQTRFNHCKNTALFALELARSQDIDKKEAYYAGLLHDITKEWDEEKARDFLKKYNFDYQLPKYMLHQETAFVLLTEVFDAKKSLLPIAIRKHTSLSLELNKLDKVVFIADKICIGRRWDGIQKIREKALVDFEEAFKVVVKKTREFNNKKGIIFTKEQNKIYEKWI